jgi:hypothetical protein
MDRHELTEADPSPLALGPPELTCFKIWPSPPELVPARAERAWMDQTRERYAYRCIPLALANASGWEISLPYAFEAAWYGGDELNTVQFRCADPRIKSHVTSHFGHGVITFHTGWLFRTSPGWAVWARGAPNTVKEGIAPLDGLVESDWLPFPFTMNWKFTRPGVVRFEAGEPFCFITLTPLGLLDDVQPKLASLDDDPKLKAAYEQWSASRADLSQRLRAQDQGAAADHLSKRRLKPPA